MNKLANNSNNLFGDMKGTWLLRLLVSLNNCVVKNVKKQLFIYCSPTKTNWLQWKYWSFRQKKI